MAQTLLTPMATLSLYEAIAGDYTNKAIIKAADLSTSPSGTTITYNLSKPVNGSVVGNVAMIVVTPFLFSDGTIVVGTASFGDGASNTTYLAASNIQGTGATTPVAASAAYASNTISTYSVQTNAQLIVAIAVTAAKNVNTCTAGELHVFWTQRNLNELAYPQQ